MIRWNGRTDKPRCLACHFDCGFCEWRLRQGRVLRAGSTVVLDMTDPATVDAIFTPGPLTEAMDRGDERCDAIRDDPDLYEDPRD